MTPPDTVILILNWNGWRDTAECIESCRKLRGRFRILVVDNGSTDGSPAELRERFPGLDLVETGANLGFAGGNNVGILRALESGADYVWLLNNDTLVAENALAELVSVMELDSEVGMVGSKINYFDAPQTIWYAGAFLESGAPHRSSHRGLNEIDGGQYDRAEETGYVTGCSLLVRRKVIEQIGILDDELFLYYEDADWCARARRGGWKLWYAPASLVLHKASVSLGGMESPRMTYYLARNLLYFVRRNFPDAFLRAFCFDLFQNVAVRAKKGRWAAAGYGVRGIFDFLRGRTGVLR